MTSPPLTINSIGVIVGLDLVGDALIKLPFVRALRAAFPQATLSWITSKGPTAYNGPMRDLTRHLIEVIYEQPPWLSTAAKSPFETSSPHFDILIDTRGRLKEAWKAKRLVANDLFIAPACHFLLSDARPPFLEKRPEHLVDRLIQLVELAKGEPVVADNERLPVSDLLLLKAKQMMPRGKVYVGLAPGAGNPAKIWPREHFIEVAQRQVELGRTPVFLLGPQEEDWLPEIKAAVPDALFPLQATKVWGTPDITIEQTLAVGSLLSIAIANDSGTGHMLAAVNCPLISLFGPTSPEKLAPHVTHGAVICAQDFGGNNPASIPVEAVLNVTEEIIKLQNKA